MRIKRGYTRGYQQTRGRGSFCLHGYNKSSSSEKDAKKSLCIPKLSCLDMVVYDIDFAFLIISSNIFGSLLKILRHFLLQFL